jgi:nicotinamidase-related amidase
MSTMLTGPTIDVFDREEFLTSLGQELILEPAKTVVLTVEMTLRRLPPDAPLPEGARDALLAQTEELLTLARSTGVAVVHVLSALREVEATAKANEKFYAAWDQIGESLSPHGIVPDETFYGQDGTFMPDLAVSVSATDYITKTKKSLSAFYQTDVEWLLKALGADTLILAGLSTNADILSTAYEASCRGFKVVTVAECVNSIYGPDLHELGLQQLGRCQGWTISLADLNAKLANLAVVS